MTTEKSRPGSASQDGPRNSIIEPSISQNLSQGRGLLAELRSRFGNDPIPDTEATTGDYHQGTSSVCRSRTRMCTGQACAYWPRRECRVQALSDARNDGSQTIHVEHEPACPMHPRPRLNRAERRAARRWAR